MDIFKSDKSIFFKIKNDLDKNMFIYSEINSLFYDKYTIFQILLDRGNLDEFSNDKVNEEYAMFSEIYSTMLETSDDEENTIVTVQNVSDDCTELKEIIECDNNSNIFESKKDSDAPNCNSTESNNGSTNRYIYVPPNYEYFEDNEKDEYASKFRMTRDQFEKLHVNRSKTIFD